MALGVHVNTVTNWRKRYESEGANGLRGHVRGKRKRNGSLLSEQQEGRVREMICEL